MKIIAYIRSSNIYDDSRATKEITALLDKGYKVVVLGWNRDGRAEEKSKELFSKHQQRVLFQFFPVEVIGGIGIKNVKILLLWMKWIRKTIKMLFNKHGVHAIHACNLDSALSVWSYGKKKRIKLVYDIYDYYIDSHNIPNFLHDFIERLEINIINKADLTIICTEERREQISKSNPKEVLVIHNSPDVIGIAEVTEKYDYAYCGSLFSGRLLQEIFQKYPQNSDLNFGIAGYGEYEGIAHLLKERYRGFSYFGAIPYNEVLRIENEAKVISAIYEPNIRNHRLCAPNKFYEALALGKPVIVCKGTGIDKIVEKYDLGVVINYDADEFYAAVRLLIQDEDKRCEIGLRARKLYENEYRWQVMKDRLICSYDRIVGK